MNSLFSSETLFSVSLTLKFSLLALFISWVFAWVIVKLDRSWVFSMSRVLWVLPSFGYAMLTLLLLRGLNVTDRFSMRSVLIAWIMGGIPYLVLGLREALSDLDSREREALRSLGASRWKTFLEFDFKRTLPSQITVLTQQFWLFLTSFSLVMILNGGPPNETMEVGIFTSIQTGSLGFSRALSLAIWQSFVLLAVKVIGSRYARKTHHVQAEWVKPNHSSKANGGVAAISALTIAICVWIWRGYSEWLNSILIAFAVSFFVAGFTFALHRFRWMRNVLEVGAWMSPVVISVMIWKVLAFQIPPLFGVIAVQVILFAPWFTRLLNPLLERTRVQEIESVRSLGATHFRAWWLVEWPRLKPTWIKGMALVATLSLGEVASILLFARGEFETLSTRIQNAFLRFQMNEGFVGTLVLILLSLLILELSELASQRRVKA